MGTLREEDGRIGRVRASSSALWKMEEKVEGKVGRGKRDVDGIHEGR